MKSIFNIITIVWLIVSNQNLLAQANDLQVYGFIHSLVVHEPPLIPVPNNETTTIYWINDIVNNTSNSFGFTGQFGQLSNHVDQLPPNDNIGFPSVSSPWNSSMGQTFETSSINTILLTAANFIQWDLPTNPDPADPQGRTIVENTETLFDWCDNQIPNMRYYIYGNWPEMDNANAFPPTVPTQEEVEEFHEITIGNIGSFDSWWLQYQDALMDSRPLLNVRLIPVGRIISQIHTEIIPNQIPFDELYEDSAPHGRANTYFLAGLISYMAMYEHKAPDDYMPSTLIHPAIRNNLSIINEFIWQELNDFNFPNGSSRVFHTTPLNNQDVESLNSISISPNPIENQFTIEWQSDEVFDAAIFTTNGTVIQEYVNLKTGDTVDLSHIPSGVYFIRFTNNTNSTKVKSLIKN